MLPEAPRVQDPDRRLCSNGEEVVVADDASPDSGSTYLVGLGYQTRGSDLPLTVVRREVNLGYGGNQKAGYRYAIDRGFDIIAMLHGDGQYAPEELPRLVAPLRDGEADAWNSAPDVDGIAPSRIAHAAHASSDSRSSQAFTRADSTLPMSSASAFNCSGVTLAG